MAKHSTNTNSRAPWHARQGDVLVIALDDGKYNPRLALPEDVGELGHRELPPREERDDAEPGALADGTEGGEDGVHGVGRRRKGGEGSTRRI